MNEREKAELVEAYLGRLSRALRGAPAGQRRELLEDVRGHIEEAWAESPDRGRASLLHILDRLGEPEDLAREQYEHPTTGPRPEWGQRRDSGAPARRAVARPVVAMLLLVLVGLPAIWMMAMRLAGPSERVPLAQMVADARSGRISLIRVREGDPEVTARYDDGAEVRSRLPDGATIAQALQEGGVDLATGDPAIEVRNDPSWGGLLAAATFILPILLSAAVILLAIVLSIRLLRGRPTRPYP